LDIAIRKWLLASGKQFDRLPDMKSSESVKNSDSGLKFYYQDVELSSGLQMQLKIWQRRSTGMELKT